MFFSNYRSQGTAVTPVRGELSRIIRIIDDYLFIILLSGIIDNLATNYHSLAWMLFPDVVNNVKVVINGTQSPSLSSRSSQVNLS